MTKEEIEANRIIDLYKFDCKIEYECRPLSVKEVVKQCALIHVQGIIEELLSYNGGIRFDYWQRVKEIIEKK